MSYAIMTAEALRLLADRIEEGTAEVEVISGSIKSEPIIIGANPLPFITSRVTTEVNLVVKTVREVTYETRMGH